jgi:hypothetical protein
VPRPDMATHLEKHLARSKGGRVVVPVYISPRSGTATAT